MTFNLSERQIKLLDAIISEYLSTSEPVGSNYLCKKYNLTISPATVRNEMAELLKLGFLEMSHSSSGRIPSSSAYKFFLTELLEEEELPVLQEVAIRQKLYANRFEYEKLLQRAVVSLAELTQELSIVSTYDGFMVHAGAVHILDKKEFWEIDVTKSALNLLDNFDMLDHILKRIPEEIGPGPHFLIGDEIGLPSLKNCSIVFSRFNTNRTSGHIAVLGPSRMKYQNVLPSIKYTKMLVEEILNS
jgi:heat-inducible transcriptional repressor